MAQSATKDSTEIYPPVGEPAIRTIAMPLDTNPAGDIFGGWLMSLMDLAADAKKEFPPSVTNIVVNGKSILVAGLLSLLAMLCLLLSLGIVVLSNDLG
jgi:hypothetical protein